MQYLNMSDSSESNSREKERRESEIQLLEYIKQSLCIRELSPTGRSFINRLQIDRRNEIARLENGT